MLLVELKTWSLTLNITINQNILNYILYIKSKDEESFVKQSFLKSCDLYRNGKSSFHSHLMEMSEYFNLPDFNTDMLDTVIVKNFLGLMKQEYISSWQNIRFTTLKNHNLLDLLKAIIPLSITETSIN